jgi:glutaredoxin
LTAVIWTKESCSFCVKAKSLLLERGYNIQENIIGKGYSKEDLLDLLPFAKTVPQIFIDNVYVGGYSDLVESHPTKELNVE